MNKIYAVIYYFNDGTTALHNIQEELISAAIRIFTASHGKGSVNFVSTDWNNGAADPFKDCSRLGAFR